MAYIFACESNGNCRQLMYEKFGWDYKSPIEYGTGNYLDGPQFKCCTGCHRPINGAEAIRLNKLLGNQLVFDDVDLSEFEDY